MIANSVPVRTPIFLTSDICATAEGAADTKAPDPNPYSAAKTMMGALAAEGSQRARVMMPLKAHMKKRTLKRPILSAMYPGIVRPKKLFLSVYA
jgi:hypothetical protein